MEVEPRLTEHARQRAAEMGLRTKVVKAIMRHPEIVYDDPLYKATRKSSGRRVICRAGEIAVPCEQNEVDGRLRRVALTVLYTKQGRWTRPRPPECQLLEEAG